jgi:hypothetical protein
MKNIAIFPVGASKRTSVDVYDKGCQLGTEKEWEIEVGKRYETALEMFQDLMNDKTIEPKHISTMDPNIYCDPRGGGPPNVVRDGAAMGLFRCHCDRMENKRGRKPSKKEMADFEAGKINLILADYDVYFHVRLVGIDEVRLSKILGVNNW